MAKIIKNKNNNMHHSQRPKFVFQEYFNFNDMRKSLVTHDTAMKIAEKVIYEIQNNPNVFKFNDICEILGMLPKEFMRLTEKFPVLKDVYDFSLLSLGNKRERGGLLNQLNSSIVNFTMPHYDKEWKTNVEWRSDLTKKEQLEKYQTFKIEMAPVASSNLVPEKKNDE